MLISLEQINSASQTDAAALLGGVYEHSPWIAEQALAARPFQSLAHLKVALAQVVQAAGQGAQLALIRAHPELAGKEVAAKALTAESASEQGTAGLAHCTAEEFAQLQQLNADYNAKFGHPFILAVRGPRGTGLSRHSIIQTFARRLHNPPGFELQECLRQIHRIAELRINDKFGQQPALGNELWDWQEALAQFSEPEYQERGQLTVLYLTDAHRSCAAFLSQKMRECGFDSVQIDAVGNVVGVYRGAPHPSPLPQAGEGANSSVRVEKKDALEPVLPPLPLRGEGRGEGLLYTPNQAAKTLLTGSHYDTVRNGGKYDGRLGIFVPMMCVRELHQRGQRLPFNVEVVGFAEEEGQRYKATFLGSGALVGSFKPEWLDQRDEGGVTMREAMKTAGLDIGSIASLTRHAGDYLGFVEVHIEQGPVLSEMNLPLGVVTSINGSVRYVGEAVGMACHAGTTPMPRRFDAACAVAELTLFVERRAAQDADSVGTVGQLHVPGGSINVVPGRCQFSLDMRAPVDAQRDALVADVLAELQAIGQRRGVRFTLELTERAAAAPSDSAWQQRWERAVAALGLPTHKLPSGAGHDAMKLHQLMPQAMLFVRGENAGISHNPLESTTGCDMQLALEAFNQLLTNLAAESA